MHNLTVAQLHTYYVLAGTTPVLVHNVCPEPIKPTYVWHPGRRGVDVTEQVGLAPSEIIESGEGIEAGDYIFVQRLDGSVRAARVPPEDDLDAFFPGHTELSGKQPVLFAGEFTVDADGKVLEMGNGSGHYMPGSYTPQGHNPDDYMSLREVSWRALRSFGLSAGEETPWNAWPVRN